MEHANGSVNGYAKNKNSLNGVNGMNGFSSSINTHSATPQRRSTPKPRPGRLSWLFSVLARYGCPPPSQKLQLFPPTSLFD